MVNSFTPTADEGAKVLFVTDELRQEISKYMLVLEHQAKVLQKVAQAGGGDDQEIAVRAMERCLQISIECIADSGNRLIDALIMRDPSSYVDIVEILQDEGVVSSELAEPLKQIVQYRRVLVQDYTADHTQDVYRLAAMYRHLQAYSTAIKGYVSGSHW